MYPRNIGHKLLAALKDTPAIILCGARQTGKSTLAQSLAGQKWKADYVSFDDIEPYSVAKEDPAGFVSRADLPIIIDEVQRVPEIFLPIKRAIDQNRKSGSFFLTGSANVLFLPKLADSLAGRVEIHTLWPLSQQEINDVSTDIISMLFEGTVPRKNSRQSRRELLHMLVKGGYPEAISREGVRAEKWHASYLTTTLQRDVRDLADIEGLTKLPKLVALLASRSGTLLNLSDVSNAIKIPYATLHRYMTLLEMTYLILSIPPWTTNIGLRLVKSPKVIINDTGLLCGILGIGTERFEKDPNLLGGVLESFVGMELTKLLEQSKTRATLYHFRSHDRKEIDYVIERTDGQLVAIEVKSSGTLRPDDFNVIKTFSSKVGKKLSAGLVLYTGDSVVRFGDNLIGAPVSILWA